jgi:hypothetical protein
VVRVHDLVPEEPVEGALRPHRRLRGAAPRARHHHPQVLPAHLAARSRKRGLLEREAQPETAWKLNPGDWKERGFWDEYSEAYEDAIEKTASPHAPWIVVPANAKWYRNLVVAEAIVAALRPYKKEWKAKLDQVGVEGKAELDRYRRSVRATKAARKRAK